MDISQILGQNLHRLRTERQLSLGQLAEKSGLSKVMLSQIEKGTSNPTVNTLWKIANGLGVSYSALMESHTQEIEVVRHDEVPVQADEDGAYRLGCYFGSTQERGFDIYEDELDCGAKHRTEGYGPRTEEFLIVQTGTLAMEVAGTEHVLSPGDAIHFDASLPHAYRNTGSETVRMTIVNTYPRD
jgi:transcriptional regulator with XRE-family HTH domain